MTDTIGPPTTNLGLEEIADEIFHIIRPFYKSLRIHGDKPSFRRSLNTNEVEELLGNLHDLVVGIKKAQSISNGDLND